MAKIDVKGTPITVVSGGADDYISPTDIARYKDSVHTDDPTEAECLQSR